MQSVTCGHERVFRGDKRRRFFDTPSLGFFDGEHLREGRGTEEDGLKWRVKKKRIMEKKFFVTSKRWKKKKDVDLFLRSICRKRNPKKKISDVKKKR